MIRMTMVAGKSGYWSVLAVAVLVACSGGAEKAAPDTVVAYDSRAQRLTRLTIGSGEVVSTVTFYAGDGSPEVYIGTTSSGSHVLAWIRQAGGRGPGVTPDVMRIGRFGPGGKSEGTLATTVGMRRLQSPLPFSPHFLADDRGRLWLKRYDPAVDSHWLVRKRTGGEWWVVETGGRVVARTAVPDGFRLMDVRGERLAGMFVDAFGVEKIQVYALEKG